MELKLTGGVLFSLLCDIKKKPISKSETRNGKKDPASELEMMVSLCEIALGREYGGNKDSLRSKLTGYKNCICEGNQLIPLEASFNTEFMSRGLECVFFDRTATMKRVKIFIHRFVDLDNVEAIQDFVDTVTELIRADINIKQIIPNNPLVKDIRNYKNIEWSFDSFLYETIYCVITSHPKNLSGKETLQYIRSGSFVSAASCIDIKIDKESDDSIESYIEELATHVDGRDGWETYLENLKKEFSKVRIFYDPDREYSFDEIYVQSYFSCRDPKEIKPGEYSEYALEADTVNVFSHISMYSIITGTGGLGKTMLMRHLLLDSIENNTDVIPILINVRDFSGKYGSFYDFIYSQCVQYSPDLKKELLLEAFSLSKCLLFIDGFDEITYQYLPAFTKLFNKFIKTDIGNTIIMTSRPVGGPLPTHFTNLYLLPLDKRDSFELVDKLCRLQKNEKLAEAFKDELAEKLFFTHKEYAENPLLLTLMLRIYEQNKMVPNFKFDFYYEAFQVLSHKHDALNKEGGFLRKYKTELSPSEFASCLREFCAYSLLDGAVSFKQTEMLKYFEMIKVKSRNHWSFSLEDFIYDCTVSTGLMYIQGERYSFIHRSMQEFFCAWFIQNQEDRLLYDIAITLQKHGKGFVWETFELLEERIPQKMKKYVYLPYLNDLFSDNDHIHDAYTLFLFRQYNIIRYVHAKSNSTGHSLSLYVEPSEVIYHFCMRNIRGTLIDYKLNFPACEDFEGEAVYEYITNSGEAALGTDFDIPVNYDYEKYGEPEIVGYNYSFNMRTVLADPNRYPVFYSRIYEQSFPLRKEFMAAQEYWKELQAECAKTIDNSDLFAQLH